jgi:hypothetical protein
MPADSGQHDPGVNNANDRCYAPASPLGWCASEYGECKPARLDAARRRGAAALTHRYRSQRLGTSTETPVGYLNRVASGRLAARSFWIRLTTAFSCLSRFGETAPFRITDGGSVPCSKQPPLPPLSPGSPYCLCAPTPSTLGRINPKFDLFRREIRNARGRSVQRPYWRRLFRPASGHAPAFLSGARGTACEARACPHWTELRKVVASIDRSRRHHDRHRSALARKLVRSVTSRPDDFASMLPSPPG